MGSRSACSASKPSRSLGQRPVGCRSTRRQASSAETWSQTTTWRPSAARTRSEHTAPPPSAITPPSASSSSCPTSRPRGAELLLAARSKNSRDRHPELALEQLVGLDRLAGRRRAPRCAAAVLPAPMKPMKTIAGRRAAGRFGSLPSSAATRCAPGRRRARRARRRCGRRRTSPGSSAPGPAPTIASPTTPAAGTTVESVRSRSASAGSLVSVSTRAQRLGQGRDRLQRRRARRAARRSTSRPRRRRRGSSRGASRAPRTRRSRRGTPSPAGRRPPRPRRPRRP